MCRTHTICVIVRCTNTICIVARCAHCKEANAKLELLGSAAPVSWLRRAGTPPPATAVSPVFRGFWSGWGDLNFRPLDPRGVKHQPKQHMLVAPPAGFEPAT